MSFGKWRPSCLGLNVLTHWGRDKMASIFLTNGHSFIRDVLMEAAVHLFALLKLFANVAVSILTLYIWLLNVCYYIYLIFGKFYRSFAYQFRFSDLMLKYFKV